MKYLHDLQNKLVIRLRTLSNKGDNVCEEFKGRSDMTAYCDKCGYSEYWHLVKQVIALDE